MHISMTQTAHIADIMLRAPNILVSQAPLTTRHLRVLPDCISTRHWKSSGRCFRRRALASIRSGSRRGCVQLLTKGNFTAGDSTTRIRSSRTFTSWLAVRHFIWFCLYKTCEKLYGYETVNALCMLQSLLFDLLKDEDASYKCHIRQPLINSTIRKHKQSIIFLCAQLSHMGLIEKSNAAKLLKSLTWWNMCFSVSWKRMR